MAHPDRELAHRCAAGDMTALEAIYRRYVDRVWRYAWFRTHSREAAAEIVQETFLRVARTVGQFEGRSSLATWLHAVTRTVAIEHYRREGSQGAHTRDPTVLRLIPSAAGEANGPDEEELRERVRLAVKELPAAQRDAIVLCGLSGMSVREASEVLGWGEARVKVTLFRARRRLGELLMDHAGRDGVERRG